jgi:K+/H+ antiporter YhaU regulatory subunit KhtT
LKREGYYFPLSPEHSINKVAPPESFVGKGLGEPVLLGKCNLNVIAVGKLEPEKAIINPAVRYAVKEGDILIVLGKRQDIEKPS